MGGEGATALPDHSASPRPHDGWPQWQWQVDGLEGSAEGPREAGRSVAYH